MARRGGVLTRVQLRESKVELENQLEIEEEYLTNKLQKQLAAVLQEKEYAVAVLSIRIRAADLMCRSTAARLEEERALREKYEQMCRESEQARQQLQKEEERGERRTFPVLDITVYVTGSNVRGSEETE